MKKAMLSALCCLSALFSFAQIDTVFTVQPGEKVSDIVPVYQYPKFQTGHIVFKDGRAGAGLLNYNYAADEMHYIRGADTLAINNVDELAKVAIGKDTFVYDRGYFQILHSGNLQITVRTSLVLLDKKVSSGTYGQMSSGANPGARLTQYNKGLKETVSGETLVLGKQRTFFLVDAKGKTTHINRKSLLKEASGRKQEIEAFIDSANLDLMKEGDIRKLIAYLKTN